MLLKALIGVHGTYARFENFFELFKQTFDDSDFSENKFVDQGYQTFFHGLSFYPNYLNCAPTAFLKRIRNGGVTVSKDQSNEK